jgi:hypothetical protein
MGTLPCWINSDLVDSAAMLGAYLASATPSDPHFGQLKIVEHNLELFGCQRLLSPAVQPVDCTKENCRRCREKCGGYQFRWYSLQWHEKYVQRARPGAWMPGDATE